MENEVLGERLGGCVGAGVGCVWCVRSVGERKYRSPLYYPDTLVNPDTCLGRKKKYIVSH